MRILPIAALALSMLPASFLAASSGENSSKYLLSMKITQGDQILGSPKLLVQGSEESKIDIGADKGRRFTLSVKLIPGLEETIDLHSHIRMVSASGKEQAFEPRLIVKLGEASAIEVGEQSTNGDFYRIDFSVSKAADATN